MIFFLFVRFEFLIENVAVGHPLLIDRFAKKSEL